MTALARPVPLRRKRSGAVSLMLAVVTAASMVVFAVFVQGARIRAAEADLLRAVRASADGVLSGYCGVLLQRYGLFGYDAGPGGDFRDRSEAFFSAARPAAASACTLEVVPGGSLADRSLLVLQIRRFVLERLPALALSTLLERVARTGRAATAVSFDPLFDSAGTGSGTEGEAWSDVLADRLLASSGEGGDGPSPGAGSGMTVADASRSLRACVADVAAMNRDAAGDPGVPQLPSPLDPEGVSAFLRGAEDRLQGLAAWIDRSAVVVYAVGMFRSRVASVATDEGTRPLRDLRGRSLSGLATGCGFEVESIVAGRSSDEENRLAVERRMLALRFAVRLVEQCVDEEKRSRAAILGDGLSVLLSAATSGALAVPGRFLAAAIQAAWAFGDARQDLEALADGRSVPALPGPLADAVPGAADWSVDYGDLLLLLLLAVPQPVLVERIAERIDENVAQFGVPSSLAEGRPALSRFHVAVEAATSFRGERIAIHATYAGG